MRQTIYFGGVVLIIISFILCVISFWLLIYGIPVFLLGTILVFFSNRTLKTKLLVTFMPIILYLPLTLLFLTLYNYTPPKVFLIPSGYQGNLRIIYNEKCGISYSESQGKKALLFPLNGVLILNEDFDGGINNEYFFLDNHGKKTKIFEVLELSEQNKRNLKMARIFIGGAGTMSDVIEADSQSEKDITYSDFYILNKNTVYQYDFKEEQKFDSITKSVVKRCRQKKID